MAGLFVKTIRYRTVVDCFVVAAVFLVLCSIFSGCAQNRSVIKDVARDDDIYVRLVKWVDNDSGNIRKLGNQHPWRVDIRTLNGILYSIKYEYLGLLSSKDKNAAFPERERLKLLRPIMEAFAKAGPDEVVDFSFMVRKRFLYVMNRSTFNSGIMFVRDGKLNIAFRKLAFDGLEEFNDGISSSTVSDPTEKAIPSELTLVSGRGINLVPNRDAGFMSEKFFRTWVQVDLDMDWASVYNPGKLKKKLRRKSTLIVPPEGSSAVVVEPATEKKEGYREVAPPAGKFDGYPEIRHENPRLKLLQELYMDGTITREVYEERKKEIMRGE